MPPDAANLECLAERKRIRVRGAVQGVGFRPHVYRLAHDLSLTGWVLNDAEGVLLEVEGTSLGAFLEQLVLKAPPLARIDAIEATCVNATGETGFAIRKSVKGLVMTSVTPDAAVCDDCLEEMCDPEDRRWRYPFLNCTHCGPRFTITSRLPYDRANTSMAAFRMCEACAAEYADPEDRRFHAQPTACPACGPKLSHRIEDCVLLLREGGIIALKGLGGFHLVCDARNECAVARLRQRKNRDAKPFAVMAANLETLRTLADISEAEARELSCPARPILLCHKRQDAGLAPSIAPGLGDLGVTLPYTPLHYLLFHEAAGSPAGTQWLRQAQDLVLVMTSANPGGEPLVIDNNEAVDRLGSLADLIVDHDRDILIRADDSVKRVIDGAPAFIRRARGYVPAPIPLAEDTAPVLAVGGHLKNTICLTRGREAFVSQHVGDLDNTATFRFFEETIAHLTDILQVQPEYVACDRHPDFLATRYAEQTGLPVIRVQHHHAHIAAAAAEHAITGEVLGLALDGYGMGDNGESWGGELFLCAGAEFQPLGGLLPLAQPGGDVAAREPWRMAAAALHALGRGQEITTRFAGHAQAAGVAMMLEKNIHSPMTSSCGRLFDAAAGLLNIASHNRYEAEAAMRLEAMAQEPVSIPNGWTITDGAIDMRPVLAMLAELQDAQLGAGIFHGVLIDALSTTAIDVSRKHGNIPIVLTGGCFINRVLAEGVANRLRAAGIEPLLHRQVPAGDGGISLGQALVASRIIAKEKSQCA